MKKFLLFVLTLFGVTMVQGQDLELTLTVDQETVCEGTEVVFTLRLSEPRSGVFELYRGEDRVGQKQTDYSCDEMEFDPLQVFGSDENEFSACLRDDSVYFSSSVSIVVNQGYVGDDAVVPANRRHSRDSHQVAGCPTPRKKYRTCSCRNADPYAPDDTECFSLRLVLFVWHE